MFLDATGVYLTQESANEHNVDYFIMCAPAKDNTPSFMVHGNHTKYSGEKVVNNGTLLTPFLTPFFLPNSYISPHSSLSSPLFLTYLLTHTHTHAHTHTRTRTHTHTHAHTHTHTHANIHTNYDHQYLVPAMPSFLYSKLSMTNSASRRPTSSPSTPPPPLK